MNLDQPPEAVTGPAIDFSICVCGRCGNSHHPGERLAEAFEPSVVPNVPLAIARGLQSAAAMVGNAAIVNDFEGMVGEVVDEFFPIDAGGMLHSRARKRFGEKIQKLLTTQ